eukprot:840404-Alexandrium_andersonii.AAC.1
MGVCPCTLALVDARPSTCFRWLLIGSSRCSGPAGAGMLLVHPTARWLKATGVRSSGLRLKLEALGLQGYRLQG